jgi:hypothetical protein
VQEIGPELIRLALQALDLAGQLGALGDERGKYVRFCHE